MAKDIKIKYLRPALRILSDRNIQLGISFLVIGFLLSGLLMINLPQLDISFILQSIPSLVGSIAGVYISYSAITRHLMDTESDRIEPREEIIETYDCPFPKVEDIHSKVDELPVAFEYVPDTVEDLSKFHFETTEEVYQLPDKVEAFLEPEMDSLTQNFKKGGKFNWRKYRLEEVKGQDGELKVSETSYFRTYITNFCPDFGVENKKEKTLREAFKAQTVSNGKIVPLSESLFSNHFGIGSFVISREGEFAITVRNKSVAVAAGQVGLPVSGSFDVEEFETSDEMSLIEPEAKEEMKFEEEELENSDAYLLGIIRRMEWLGKPDALSILVVDEIGDLEDMTEESDNLEKVETDLDIEDGTELFRQETAKELLEHINNKIENRSNSFRPTVGLLAWMLLFKHHAGIDTLDEEVLP